MKDTHFLPTVVVAILAAIFICPPSISAEGPSPDETAKPNHPISVPQIPDAGSASGSMVTIPGPLRSFERMAGISQNASPASIIAILARNIWISGYEYGNAHQRYAKRTEFLILLERYVDQARELRALAGPDETIRIANCQASGPLLKILGYQLREPCGSDTSLETADPERAFITVDSGFPLAQLEEDLRQNTPFTDPFHGATVPVIFTPEDWTSRKRFWSKGDILDSLLHDPDLARLYWAFSRMDDSTRAALLHSPGLRRLELYASLLDFYGSTLYIRDGQMVLPGGPSADAVWRTLAGADPKNSTAFIVHLLEKDKGWPIDYFDVLSRTSPEKQAFFAQPERLERLYKALQADDSADGPARPVFRPDPGLLLLVTQLQLDPDGEPHIPGGLNAWKEILDRQNGLSKIVRRRLKRVSQWNSPEQLLEAMFSLSRMPEQAGPLYLYLTLNEIDRERGLSHPLSSKTVLLLADKFARFGDQFPVFAEFHELNDASIAQYLAAAERVDRITAEPFRGNAAGMLQAMTGLWQILARQQEIPAANFNQSWQSVVRPFVQLSSYDQLFDDGRVSLEALLTAATGNPDISEDDLIELLAGPAQRSNEGMQAHQLLAQKILNMLDDQRLVSLDTLLTLGSGLDQMEHGQDVSASLIPLAHEVEGFEMPRPLFTSGERTDWTLGLYENRRSVMRVQKNLSKLIRPSSSKKDLNDAREALAPFLKSVLVGLNYAYYEPPGAQMIHNNALFVRSHDFTGQMTADGAQTWEVPHLVGTGLTAAGGAYLAGSLADLPYVLSETEQNFIVPQSVQALIWEDLVPDLLTSAVLPRWWNVSHNEMHALALFQRAGEDLIRDGANNDRVREEIINLLSTRILPRRLENIDSSLRADNPEAALAEITPADSFYLAVQFRADSPNKFQQSGRNATELDALALSDPAAVEWKRLSEDFGIPHPALAQTYSRELLNLKPFPPLMGYSSRLLAECWDSSNLYWARLADEMGYPPVMLNILVPQLTRRMVEQIFASDFQDWPAILHAMRQTGAEFRRGKLASFAQIRAAVEH